jgi:hypothetical protein
MKRGRKHIKLHSNTLGITKCPPKTVSNATLTFLEGPDGFILPTCRDVT